MFKFNKMFLAPAVLAAAILAPNTYGQLVGVGYSGTDEVITARIGVGANLVTVGLGGMFDSDVPANAPAFEARFVLGFLGHLHNWEQVNTYFNAQIMGDLFDRDEDNFELAAFVGLQPEVTLFDHIVLSTRFGLEAPIMPAFSIGTDGRSISVVSGVDFTIKF